MVLRDPGRELGEFLVCYDNGPRTSVLLIPMILRKSCWSGVVLQFSGRELDVVQVCWGLEPGVYARPMMNLWHIFQSVLCLRGWGYSGRM